ncbi:DNA-directed RNA polymerase subunit delta [Candidatus Phytoplasma phoenicium]|uniref:RNAP delta factor n=1 Tax=Candidatus Phytoplasma phoenicium TaxID=198422 RepID=A0A0L0MJN2_9MOLU|nr:DNA-directed RNA polymerase subunit delta [Candidatus Phytoplasma phoenicium]KND62510.1 DNA-directed RNA polymerase delta subunit [Candidatus Phytoplasma phoenicium]
MKKENKNNDINEQSAMINISYEILKSHKEPMSIYELISKVLKIKQIDEKEIDKVSQLYLDIVSSGRFVFYGNDLWSIKNNNLHLWDKEYFVNDKEATEENQKTHHLENEILDFDDFTTKNKMSDVIEEEKEEEHLEEYELELHDDKLDNETIINDDNIKDKTEIVEEEDMINEYEYFYEDHK